MNEISFQESEINSKKKWDYRKNGVYNCTQTNCIQANHSAKKKIKKALYAEVAVIGSGQL